MPDFVTPWTGARQAPLSMGFPRQGYGSRLRFPTLGDLPDPRIEPISLVFPALAAGFFITELSGKPSLQRLCVHTHTHRHTDTQLLWEALASKAMCTHTHRHTHSCSGKTTLQRLCVHTHTPLLQEGSGGSGQQVVLESPPHFKGYMCTHTHTHTHTHTLSFRKGLVDLASRWC